MAKLIRVDGSEEELGDVSLQRVSALIANGGPLDSFQPRGGGRVFVDDVGLVDGKPVNAKGTALYHTRTGGEGSIHGDVVVFNKREEAGSIP